MENEIIINDVDVRFCQYFNNKNKKCRTCSYVENIKYTSYKCEDAKNCYYKQLKRLEAENKELKTIIKNAIDDFNHEYGTPYYEKLKNEAVLFNI